MALHSALTSNTKPFEPLCGFVLVAMRSVGRHAALNAHPNAIVLHLLLVVMWRRDGSRDLRSQQSSIFAINRSRELVRSTV